MSRNPMLNSMTNQRCSAQYYKKISLVKVSDRINRNSLNSSQVASSFSKTSNNFQPFIYIKDAEKLEFFQNQINERNESNELNERNEFKKRNKLNYEINIEDIRQKLRLKFAVLLFRK